MAEEPGLEQSELDSTEALLLETYGLPLLCFLCATDETSMQNRLRGQASRLSRGAEDVLVQLAPLARSVAGQPGLPKAMALEVLARPSREGAAAVGVTLRQMAGGTIDPTLIESAGDDPVKRLLVQIAIDCFPLYLAPSDRYWSMPVSMFHHPLRGQLQAAVQADDALGSMYPADDNGLGRRGYVMNSLGRGGTVQDVMFGEMVVGSAWNSAAMTSAQPGLAALVEHVNRSVDVLRTVLAGGQASVPAKIVFTGFTTSSHRIDTPWGALRPLHDWERRLAPPDLEGAVSGTDNRGQQVTVSYAGEMVLETEVAYALRPVPEPAGDAASDWPRPPDAFTLRRRLEAVPLAVLLATHRPVGSWVTARLAWTWTGDPFAHGRNVGWMDVGSGPSFMPSELTETECEEVSEWASRIERHWIPQIEVAVRRLLSAANSRTDMSDRLIDAVIVWESLFGTRQGESALRISAAMAWLLADSVEARRSLQSEVKGIYNDRSAIVHGRQLADSVVVDRANAAISHARQALQVLLRDRPDILAMTGDGARSVYLITGD